MCAGIGHVWILGPIASLLALSSILELDLGSHPCVLE